MTTIDYAVIYDKNTETLYFMSDDMGVLSNVEVQIFTVGGRILYAFKADGRQSLEHLPSGTYIVRWTFGNVLHNVKFRK